MTYNEQVAATLTQLANGQTTPLQILTGLTAEQITDLGGES